MNKLLIIDPNLDFSSPIGNLSVPGGKTCINKLSEDLADGSLIKKYEIGEIVICKEVHPAGHISFNTSWEDRGGEILPVGTVVSSTDIGTKYFLRGYSRSMRVQLHDQIAALLYKAEGKGNYLTLWPEHCKEGTWGAKLPTELTSAIIKIAQADSVNISIRIFTKGGKKDAESYSPFSLDSGEFTDDGKELLNHLIEGDGRIFICGLAKDYCVAKAVKDLQNTGAVRNNRLFYLEDYMACIDSKNPSLSVYNRMGISLSEEGEKSYV